MTSPLQAIGLGVLQGLTEFLPISSSAHLILWPRFFGWKDPGLAFDVALHLGTLAGVALYFAKDLWRIVRRDRRLLGLLVVGTIPAALAGLLLERQAETAFRSPVLIACALILMGGALALADQWFSGRKTMADLTYLTALGLGIAQAVALIPGVSRSGMTITAAMLLGYSRREAARFSFLLSIPIIAGAGVLKVREIFLAPDQAALAAGFGSAAVAGFLAIWGLLRYVQTRHYTPFVLYRWALGAFVLLNLSRFQP
jgi:undecaprenyl-diphosphatase